MYLCADWEVPISELDFAKIENFKIKKNQRKDKPKIKEDEILGLKQEKTSLTDCFNLFVKEEAISVQEECKCEKCKIFTPHTKKMGFYRFPEYLIVTLKWFRFGNADQNRGKIDTLIDFPLWNLNLTEFLLDKRKV